MSKPADKYYTPPAIGEEDAESSPYIFSMIKDETAEVRLRKLLASFPNASTSKKASASLVWSGSRGNNVPVKVFKNYVIGYVINPQQINALHGEFYAFETNSQTHIERSKAHLTLNKGEKLKSKYPQKKGRIGIDASINDPCMGSSAKKVFVPNHAKIKRLGPIGEGFKEGNFVFEPRGSFVNFANNVWRKFFKPKVKEGGKATGGYDGEGVMKLNELIVEQKGEVNPIDGILLRMDPQMLKEDTLPLAKIIVSKIYEILKEYKGLKLYLYDEKAEEHIMRPINNDEALEQMEKFLRDEITLEEIFANAKPSEIQKAAKGEKTPGIVVRTPEKEKLVPQGSLEQTA